MKLKFLLLTLIVIPFNIFAKNSLNYLLEIGLKNAFNIKIQKLKLEQSSMALKNSWGSLLPTVGLSAGREFEKTQALEDDNSKTTTSTWTNSLSLSAKWSIWDNFENITKIQSSRISYQVEKIRTKKEIQDYILKVFDGYFNLLLAHNNKKILVEQLNQANWVLKKAQELVKVGAKTPVDSFNSEIQAANIERDILENDNRVEIFEKNLNFLISPEKKIKIPISNILDINPYFMEGFENNLRGFKANFKKLLNKSNFDLRVLKLEAEKSRLQYRQKKLDHFPKISAEITHDIDLNGYVQDEVADRALNTSKISINVTWDGWTWFNTTREIDSVGKDYAISRYNLKQSKFAKSTEIDTDFRKYNILLLSIKSSEKILEKAKKQLEYSNEMYSLGKITILDIQQSTISHFRAQEALAQRLSEKYLLAGKLINSFGGNLIPRGK